MPITTTEKALLRLMQLGSASLPVGGFAYSQGLEYAVEAGWLKKSADVGDWLELQLSHTLSKLDLAVIFRLYQAMEFGGVTYINYWNDFLLASRETKELRLTDTSMGLALKRLMPSLQLETPKCDGDDVSFVTIFVAAAWQWDIDVRTCALGFSWSWLENQVAAATKLVPLGQTQAQQLLGQLQNGIPRAIDIAESLADEELGAGLPALAIASSLHETQYSRLFRS